ncbi:STAS domain-containing protein [Dactylosporangium siamense]|uniref:STAS domain-containing protein n=1 Tax=Dactylosporangium siamense TaxID=685454 RepID=A0A919U853_9ACTN|nr:STAS domain-containing protein [Dactylosporangium siamense]GIG42415.1 hypothetical protein Dsi01nite_004560 [Dactylosporangium siamense]
MEAVEQLAISVEPLLVRDAQLVRAAGRLTARNRHRLRRAVQKRLVECPIAVILDITGLELADPPAAATFVAMHRDAAAADVELLLHGGHGPLTQRIRVLDPALPQFRTLAEAVAAAGEPPRTGRWTHRRFAPGPQTLRLAGCLVADACTAWHLPDLVHPARSALHELFQLGHRCPAAQLHIVVALRRTGLLLSVRSQLVAGHRPDCQAPQCPPGSGPVIRHSAGPDYHARWALLPVTAS